MRRGGVFSRAPALPCGTSPSLLAVAPTIGLVYRSGKPLPSSWSGIPAGLGRAFSELGFDVRFSDAEPPPPVVRGAKLWATVARGSRDRGMLAPEIRALRRTTARRRLDHRKLDAVVQMGSDFGVPYHCALATYDDQTVAQLNRVYPIEDALGTRAFKAWVSEQAKIYRRAAACCAMSHWAGESIADDYGVDPERIHVVGAGRNYEPRPVDRDWTTPRFFFMGHDWERKNGALVVQAFRRVRERFPAAALDVVGGHPRLDVDGVVGHGPLDFRDPHERARAEALFEHATCFVMPSQCENFGIVYVEAGAAGVPSIGPSVGGASDAIGDGGLLVDPTDEEALLDAMLRLCDPARASAMGASALERSRLFTWEAVARRIADALGLPVSDRLPAGP